MTPAFRDVWHDIRDIIRARRGTFAIGFVLMLINRASGLVLPGSTKFLLDNILTPKNYALLPQLVMVVAVATLIQGVTSFLLTQVVSKAAQQLIAEMREKVQRHINRLPISFFDANKTGVLVSRIMSDVEGIRNLLGAGLLEFVGGFVTASIALVVLLYISPSMTAIAITVVALFSVMLVQALKRIRPVYSERGAINADVMGRLTESLGGVRIVKGYRAEERESQVFSAGSRRLLANVMKSMTATSLLSMSATILMGIVGATIMYVGSRQIASGTITLGGFGAFTMFLAFLVAPVVQVVSIGTQMAEALAGLGRTHQVLAESPEDGDPLRTRDLPVISGRIEFEHVDFAYTPGRPVLEDVSFVSDPGTVTALVGPSGSGKSTITGLLAAFYKPERGVVRVDGVNLSKIRLESFRSQIGLVLQESFLFDGTIRENVLFARPSASEAKFQWACGVARVRDFALECQDGYDCVVGERGVKLSGGQKQRVSIARAILADPRILILDEATSSLDSESEALIQEGLEYLMRGRTTFVIAHRLSTIRRADQILFIEHGCVTERGTHESLLASRGRYYDLYMRQQGLHENLFLALGEGGEITSEGAATAARDTCEMPPLSAVTLTGY